MHLFGLHTHTLSFKTLQVGVWSAPFKILHTSSLVLSMTHQVHMVQSTTFIQKHMPHGSWSQSMLAYRSNSDTWSVLQLAATIQVWSTHSAILSSEVYDTCQLGQSMVYMLALQKPQTWYNYMYMHSLFWVWSRHSLQKPQVWSAHPLQKASDMFYPLPSKSMRGRGERGRAGSILITFV